MIPHKYLFALLLAMLALLPCLASAQAEGSVTVRGRVLPVGADSLGAMRAHVRAGAYTDSADVGADGRFSLRVPRVGADSLDVLLDAAVPERRVFHPALVRMATAEAAREHEVVLVPRWWKITGGRYAGMSVEVSVARAFGRACATCGTAFYRWAPGTGDRAIAGWPRTRFPLRVAFDREWSGEAISARDSARFWRAVETLEEAFGEDLFRPAAYADAVPRADGGNEDVILVWVDPALRDFTGFGSAVSSAGDVAYGDLRLRRGALQDQVSAGLVMHELLHTLGFGHTCAWRSVLADSRRCPYLHADEATPEDVAYVQLATRVRELERAARGRLGMRAALAGEHSVRAGSEGIGTDPPPIP